MKNYAFCLALLVLTTIPYADADAESLVYNFEFEKKQYVAKSTIEYPAIKMIARRGEGELQFPSEAILISYRDKKKDVVAQVSSKLNLRPCVNADFGQRCAFFAPEMLLNFYKISCSVQIEVGHLTKILPWGQCQDRENPSLMVDLASEIEDEDEDVNLKLRITNRGKASSKPFRVLLRYLDANDREISYAFKDVPNKILANQTQVIPIEENYLYGYTCKLKVILDPDYRSYAVPKIEHLMTVRYGDCLGDSFEPYVDLSAQSPRITSSYSDSLLQVLISNNGDQAVSGRSLEVKIEGFDSQKKPVFKERMTSVSLLGPKESDSASVKVSNHILEKVCMISFEVNATNSLLEFNKNNNKTFLNRCN